MLNKKICLFTAIAALMGLGAAPSVTNLQPHTQKLLAFNTDEMVKAHNDVRNAENKGLPSLTYTADLAKYAQEWADQLKEKGFQLEHRPNNSYGENIYWSAGSQSTPRDVVQNWASEKANYNYANNSCAADQVCGHYTQVVWKKTTKVGCGMASGTADMEWPDGTVKPTYQEIWVCNYNPPGNFEGEKPY